MFLAASVIIILVLIFGPSLWVKLVMKTYSSEKPEIPGTGGELAKHLIERFSLKDVTVEVTELGDHYDPIEKKVRLTRPFYLAVREISNADYLKFDPSHNSGTFGRAFLNDP